MATSRTGTAQWKRIARQARYRDRHLTNCPRCNVALNWEQSRHPNSAEVDHITPHARGGKDHIDNTQIICRRCNQSLGDKRGHTSQRKVLKSITSDTIGAW